MEPVALSLMLMLVLAALVGGMTAVERAAVAFAQSGRPPRWTGWSNAARPWACELRLHCAELPRLLETGDSHQRLGRVICLLMPVLAFAVIPFAPPSASSQSLLIAPDVEPVLIFVIAMLALGAFGEVLAGRGSDGNSTAARIAVVAALGLAAVGIARIGESWRLDAIVGAQEQADIWWLARQPLGFAAMLLCLVWMMLGIAPPKADEPVASGQTPAGDPLMLASHLQLIAAAYLLVTLFLGGWHVWGIASPAIEQTIEPDSMSPGLRWFACLLAFHLKAAVVLLWLVWLRFVRLPQAERIFWRKRSAEGAMTAAVLNLIVTEFVEQYLAAQPMVWKSAVAWIVLTAGLAIIGLFAGQLAPEQVPGRNEPDER